MLQDPWLSARSGARATSASALLDRAWGPWANKRKAQCYALCFHWSGWGHAPRLYLAILLFFAFSEGGGERALVDTWDKRGGTKDESPRF